MNRRRLIELALTTGALSSAGLGAWTLPLSAALAAEPRVRDRYFVFAYFEGGWDQLLALDPRSPDDFPSSRAAETGIEPAYERLQGLAPEDWLVDGGLPGMTFGPYIGNLVDHVSRLCVVRGLQGESVAHSVARRHILTGVRPAGTSVRASSMATLLAFLLGEDEPIPNLVCGLDSYNVGHPSWASGLATDSAADLFQALSPGPVGLAAGAEASLQEFFAAQAARTGDSALAAEVYGNRSAARNLVDLGLAEFFNLDSGTAEMLRLREAFGIDSELTGTGGPNALMAAQALTQGVSRCVSFEAARRIDSHQGAEWSTEHGPKLQQGFHSVAALAAWLEATPFGDGTSWLDHTTIVCLSEFAREPLLNSDGGRDHNLVGSLALLGGGVRGGQVVGSTSDSGMQALSVDLTTGALDPSGQALTPEHIGRTLVQSIGLDDDVGDFRVEPAPALMELP